VKHVKDFKWRHTMKRKHLGHTHLIFAHEGFFRIVIIFALKKFHFEEDSVCKTTKVKESVAVMCFRNETNALN
jgi:hypothetical protein